MNSYCGLNTQKGNDSNIIILQFHHDLVLKSELSKTLEIIWMVSFLQCQDMFVCFNTCIYVLGKWCWKINYRKENEVKLD